MKSNTEALAQSLGLTKTTRFINVLELGVLRNSSNEAPTQRGWEIGIELPLFDWGGARVARAEAIYMQALHRAAETAINARSEVREAYGNYRSAYDIARHQRDEIVPLKKRISEEQGLRYNGMIIGVFELLSDSRDQVGVVIAAIGAQEQFWLADAALQATDRLRERSETHGQGADVVAERRPIRLLPDPGWSLRRHAVNIAAIRRKSSGE